MLRLLFEKKGNAIWISHLDLMRLFQRAFKRAGLPLTHTQGYNPRPSVSIALPLSVGVESQCELLEFQLDGMEVSTEHICSLLNDQLVDGIRVLEVYEDGKKLRELAYLKCRIILEYDGGIPANCTQAIQELLTAEEILVEKKSKNGITEQNIASMIREMSVFEQGNQIIMEGVICCQNPSLNPAQIVAGIQKFLPDYAPSFSWCSRLEIFDSDMKLFR